MTDELDLEGCWSDLRCPKGSSEEAPSQLRRSLLDAHQKASIRLIEEELGGTGTKPLTTVVSRAVALFMEEWYQTLRDQNLAGLIEIVLEGQHLVPNEMQEFVQALPYSLLERICQSAMNSASGIHGLMAIEFARRNRNLRSYNIYQDGSRTYVQFTTLDDRTLKFYLDEKFDLEAGGVSMVETEE